MAGSMISHLMEVWQIRVTISDATFDGVGPSIGAPAEVPTGKHDS